MKNSVKKFKLALDLKRGLVGVKFFFDESEFKLGEARTIKGKMPYCVMVRKAMLGFDMKVTRENSACVGAENALGIEEITQELMNGKLYRDKNFYVDLATSRDVIKNASRFNFSTYGIEIKPLEQYSYPPDVVLMVTNAYQAMRIIQSYTYIYGGDFSIKTVGNQAVCSECTANPYENNSINASFLCSGTRYNNRWGDDELMIGVPFNKFLGLSNAVYETLDTFESNEKKKIIEENTKQDDIDFDIKYSSAYFYKGEKNWKHTKLLQKKI